MGFNYLLSVRVAASDKRLLVAVRAVDKLLHAFILVVVITGAIGSYIARSFLRRALGLVLNRLNSAWDFQIVGATVLAITKRFAAGSDVFLKHAKILETLWGAISNLSPWG